MNIDKLKKQFNDENSCRHFFESVIWVDGRQCPHCQCDKSYLLKGASELMNVRDANDNLQ